MTCQLRVRRGVRAAVAMVGFAALLSVPACRRQTGPPPLRPNPGVAAEMDRQRAEEAFRAAAARMSPQAVAFLERSITDDEQGFQTVRRLRVYYETTATSVLPWNELIARRLPHVLWLIAHRAEDPASVWPISRAADPTGYARAADAWMARASAAPVTPSVLFHAAAFLTGHDNLRAESLLLKARSLDPTGTGIWGGSGRAPSAATWSAYLGQFYGRVLAGTPDPATGRASAPLESDPFALDVRQRLLADTDARKLAGVAQRLLQVSRTDDAREALGLQLLERALVLAPDEAEARRLKTWLAQRDRTRPIRQAVLERQLALAGPEIGRKVRAGETLTPEEQQALHAREFEAIRELPGPDRLTALADAAEARYLWSETRQAGGRDSAGVRLALDQARTAAEEVLALVSSQPSRPEAGDATYRSHVVLALCALRGGNRTAALTHMAQAQDAPASPPEFSSEPLLASRLANYLLRAGERGTVAVFLEKSAGRGPLAAQAFRQDAAAIRAGEMPVSYQHMFAR